ncbi:MAG: efflux RND transporter permease subunit, partial [Methylocella sp.]
YGALAAVRTPVDIFPNIGIPVISVVWSFHGIPADDMSGRIVYFYERSLTTTVNDIEHIESQSLAGFGIVKIFFQPGVDISAAQAQVAAVSQTVLKLLPPGITPPFVLSYNASSVPVIQVALSSDKLSQARLNDLGLNFIRPQLATVAGAALPSPFGGVIRQVQVDLDQRALRSYGLSAEDVGIALSAQNQITPVGTEKIGKFEYTINLNDSPKRIEEFNDLPIKAVNGTVVYMRDVAYVHDSAPPQTNVVQLNGRKAVLMTVLKRGSVSTLDVIAGVKNLLPVIAKSLPEGLEMKLVGDESVFVKSAVGTVIQEGLIAATLTGLMILLFVGSWRSTLIITVSIPLAILASLTALSALGETLNIMTLGGLAIAVGILVDDATVTLENINFHLEQGKPVEPAIL